MDQPPANIVMAGIVLALCIAALVVFVMAMRAK